MIRSPCLSLGTGHGWLPWSDQSAAVVAQWLVDGRQAEEAARRLESSLATDPGLAWWAYCHAGATLGQRANVRTLADWFSEHARGLLAWHDPGTLEARDELANRCATIAAQAVVRAGNARANGDAASNWCTAAYLVNLLAGSSRWPVVDCSACGNGQQAGQAVGLAMAEPLWAGAVEGQQDQEPGSEGDQAAEARRRWRQEVPGAAMLPRLAEYLARLESLESRFGEQLEIEKLEAMAEFAAGAGHEINNPLAVIAGRAQLLLQSENDPERRRDLAVINSQAMRVYEMIADMMLFARPPRPRRSECKLRAIVQSVMAALVSKARDRRVELVTESLAVEEADLTLMADADQLAVALRALCDNAIYACSGGGRVVVSVRREERDRRGDAGAGRGDAETRGEEGKWIEIVVEDDGPGLSPEVRRHAFDPFYSGRGAGRGLGMGLAKCWRIVCGHEGTVRVENAPVRGARFVIRLPAGTRDEDLET